MLLKFKPNKDEVFRVYNKIIYVNRGGKLEILCGVFK